MRSRLFAALLAVVLLLLSGPTPAQTQGRMERVSFTWTQTGFPVGQCTGFQILIDAVAQMTLWFRYDGSGNLVTQNQMIRVLGEDVYYNSVDPTKAISGGPGEMEMDRFTLSTGVFESRGIPFKVRVPGHGMIFAETGRVVVQCDPYTFANCSIVSNVGFNQQGDGDTAILCEHLQ